MQPSFWWWKIARLRKILNCSCETWWSTRVFHRLSCAIKTNVLWVGSGPSYSKCLVWTWIKSLHPQIDGQTERVNALLEFFLRHSISTTQTHWVKLLDVAQFSYNMQRSDSMNQCMFDIMMGQQPLMPSAIAKGYVQKSSAAYRFTKGWHDQAYLAQSCLQRLPSRWKSGLILGDTTNNSRWTTW